MQIFTDVDHYISTFPENMQKLLVQMRSTNQNAAPAADEFISYGMPAYKQNGVLVYFAAFKNHIGFYPTATGIAHFKKELSGFKGGKGSVQFTINKELPIELICEIVKFKLDENIRKLNSEKK
jgi:uncharacterized protein YdhG (YjbR/CyaY superfamily)